MPHTLAVLTVVYRNYTILQDFIASFEKQTDRDFKIYVADLSEKKEPYPYPPYATCIPGDNKGYAHGINVCLKQALKDGYDNYAVINSDVAVSDSFVASVKQGLNKYPGSLLGGKIYYGAGYEYHKDRYQESELGKVLWYAGGISDWDNALTVHRGVDEVDHGQYDQFGPTEFISGCLSCFDKKVLDTVGFWDESYFLYYEDADYCERAKRKHIPLYYDPEIVIWHKNAASTGGSGSTVHTKYQRNNHVMFGLKYAPLKTKLHLLKNFFLNRNRI